MKGILHSFASFLSCKQYTELASRALDEPLTFSEKLRSNIHWVLCLVCRRFNKQIKLIHTQCNYLANQEPITNIELSDAAAKRISEAISKKI
jgi:hypothetical protein